jgi:hypothetical protein
MKKSFSGMLVAALALVGVLGTSSNASATLLIDFDQSVFDGGTFATLGGGNYSGSGILFDTILYRDTAAPGTGNIAGLQCGTGLEADACTLNFNTALNTFTVTAPTGLWNVGADFKPYTGDGEVFVAGTTGTILSGTFNNWIDLAGVAFIAGGTDTKDPEMLSFFGLAPGTPFIFANTEIHLGANGEVLEADLTNIVTPEPATMMLLGTGLLAAFRARRKSA